MSTFTVTPEVAYNISIGAPGIAGTPTPTVSYAWTYNGTAIGTNSRFVNNYTFPSFPGTLACTITLTNIVGSVSQTVSATIQQASNLPTLSAVTIRNNATPTVPITTIANGNAGVVLRVGGPSAPDINPVATNANSLSYQWRRGAENIAGATGQTYTLVAADEDSTIAVVVTAENLDGSASRSAAIAVGAPVLKVPRGEHIYPVNYYDSGITFANLIYSSVNGVAGQGYDGWVGRGVAGGNEAERFGNNADWTTAREICTADGWPYRSLFGDISESQPCRTAIVVNSIARLWSALELPIAWDGIAFTNGNAGAYRPQAPDSLLGKRFKYDVCVYWEGNGYAWANSPDIPLPAGEARPTDISVVFAQSPFADGRSNVQFSKTSRTFSYPPNGAVTEDSFGGGRILVSIESSDPTKVNPLKNMIVLVSNVREVDADGNTINVVYEGFDETNYTPFALYPAAKEKFQRSAHLRTLQLEHARNEPKYYDRSLTVVPTGETWQQMGALTLDISDKPVRRELVAATPHPSGAELGWRAIDRPTHSGFGRSLRAVIEVCNQCDCNLYWCHPYTSIEVGTPTENGVILANSAPSLEGGWNPPDVSDPNQAGRVLVNQEYIDYFVETTALLKPGLKVYSEWTNEVWNNKVTYSTQHFYAYNMCQRIIAEPQYGGDGDVLAYRSANRTIGAGGRFPGTQVRPVGNLFGIMMSAIASAHIAKACRESGMSRELVAVVGGRHRIPGQIYQALEQIFALQPYLFKHLDAIATAPYYAATAFYLNSPGPELYRTWAEQLIALGGWEAAWEFQINENKVHLPWTDPESFWVMRTNSQYPNRMRVNCALTKEVALDTGYTTIGNTFNKLLPVGWDPSRRRWNLRLMSYEGGSETYFDEPQQAPLAIRLQAQAQTLEFHSHPGQQLFNRRYHEMLFSPSTKGLVTDAVPGSDDEAMYMPGRVPAGVVPDAEPMFDSMTHLLSVDQWSAWGVVFWSEQTSSRHDSPSHRGMLEAVQRGVGLPNWWVNYDYGA